MKLNLDTLDTPSIIKWLILGVLVIFSCYVTFPAKDNVRLGLDLQGGTSFTVELDPAKLESDIATEKFEEEFRTAQAKAKGAPIDEALLKSAAEAYAKTEVTKRMVGATDRTLDVLRRRIDALGTNEPIIARDTTRDRIFIQIPGADEAQAKLAEESVNKAAFLEFRIVDSKNEERVAEIMALDKTPKGFVRGVDATGHSCFFRADDYAQLSQEKDFSANLLAFGQSPKYSRLYACFMEEVDNGAVAGKPAYRPIFLSRSPRAMMDGSTIINARAEHDNMQVLNPNVVSIEFNDEGSKKFADLTRKNVNRQMAIVLDGIVHSAPNIREAITHGRCQISGNFTWKDVTNLAGILNAGALSVPIKVVEKRSVSPTLGEEAISRGTLSACIGVVAVLIFMIVYYALCGVVANVALVLNMVLWPAGMIIASGLMSVFLSDGTGSTSLGQLPVLTLPGIAGLVLSVGMAVDANVLIFERMREEFTAGNTAKAAVSAGYDRAFLAIVDSNLTTLMTGVILFVFGSGPIRGFAVTLCGGIIISMFTALIVTRLIFNLFVGDTIKPFKMMKWVSEKVNFDFIGKSKIAIMASVSIIVITLSIFFIRAKSNPASVFAVDFVGGLSLTYKAVDAEGKNAELDIEKVRSIVKGTGVTDQTIQEITGEAGEVFTLVKTSTTTLNGAPTKDVIEKAIDEAFPEYKVQLHSEDSVGSQIGDELKSDAFWSIVIALIGIIIYVSVRFQFGFALGGVVALAHDALITLGIYTITGNQVSLTTVAALLTIVGYSINDTIVIFDRIREEMARDEETDFPTLVRRALNQTLSRTLLTTLSTLLPVCALYFFGGAAIHDFAFALFIGMLVGTYSTLFIAPTVMLAWYKGKRPPKTEVTIDPSEMTFNN